MNVMNERRLQRLFSISVALLTLAHLAWEHFHGGIRRHHLLAREDLPSISNLWGLVTLPALGWLTARSIEKRLAKERTKDGAPFRSWAAFWAGLGGAMVVGVLLSLAFRNGREDLASHVLLGTVLSAVVLPVYRAEYLLGFVLAMTFAFGAILPTAIGGLIAGLSALVHLGIRPLVARLWARMRA